MEKKNIIMALAFITIFIVSFEYRNIPTTRRTTASSTLNSAHVMRRDSTGYKHKCVQ
jgi:hypothetical protein